MELDLLIIVKADDDFYTVTKFLAKRFLKQNLVIDVVVFDSFFDQIGKNLEILRYKSILVTDYYSKRYKNYHDFCLGVKAIKCLVDQNYPGKIIVASVNNHCLEDSDREIVKKLSGGMFYVSEFFWEDIEIIKSCCNK